MLTLESFKQQRKKLNIVLPVVSSTWRPPKDFPNLSAAKSIALDTETFDPELLEAGPGWSRNKGHIVGVSLAVEDAAWYFPVRHKLNPELNLDPTNVFSWLNSVLNNNKPKIGANLAYDVGWLNQEGVSIHGKLYDIQAAEALIDGGKFTYSLESIAQQYLEEGKESNELYAWCARAYGGKADGKQRANIYRAPVSLVGAYAEADARLPLAIFSKQWEIMEKDGLLRVFDLETRILPMLIAMRQRGVRINEAALVESRKELNGHIKEIQKVINQTAGFPVNVNSAKDLKRICEKFDIPYEVTGKGNPSFQATWLERQPHEILHWVREVRKLTKTVSTFIDGLQTKNVDGRIYTTFNALRSDSGGTITGRFSSSNPNLQNIPARDKKLGPLMRSIFIPDEFFPQWCKLDYSSIEFRCFAHRSQDPFLIEAYNRDPYTDFHAVVEKMVGGELPRVAYKTFNFSRMYGGGVTTITAQMFKAFNAEERDEAVRKLGYTPLTNTAEQLARLLITMYDERFPMVMNQLQKELKLADKTGEVRTQLGRRITFDLKSHKQTQQGMSAELAAKLHGDERFGSYKALNYYNQGTSADIMKMGMVLAWEDGLFVPSRLGAPHLTVHDELDFSYHPDMRKDLDNLKIIMQEAIQLSVPIIVDEEFGTNWGNVKEIA